MARFLRFFRSPLKRLIYARVPLPLPTIGLPTISQLMASLSVLGFICLVFLGGAAVMFFQLPLSDFLGKAFAGARAWHERGQSSIPPLPRDAAESAIREITVDDAEKTYDGFTLYT